MGEKCPFCDEDKEYDNILVPALRDHLLFRHHFLLFELAKALKAVGILHD